MESTFRPAQVWEALGLVGDCHISCPDCAERKSLSLAGPSPSPLWGIHVEVGGASRADQRYVFHVILCSVKTRQMASDTSSLPGIQMAHFLAVSLCVKSTE